MPLLPSLGRSVGSGVKAVRLLARGSVRGGAWATRRVGSARARGAANEVGMIRLFDLHALSCAGDTLLAIGLAGTIFFNVPLGEARSKVALYLLITMVPFALLAPVVGPLLDHFRHGRRYALATTMLGRAFLAYVIADNLFGWGLYPAAFGVLALSRAYGVARSAAVPRLLPQGVGLSQVGARASVYGTFAGAVVAPIGLLAFKFGPQWPLRVAAIIFVIGMVISLRLPPRADSEPPEAVPRPWRTMLRLGRGEDRPLSGPLIVATLVGSASLRLLYGFMLLFLAFVIMADQLGTTLFGQEIGRQAAVGVIGGSLAVGTFLSTAVGTRLRIRRPLALQAAGLAVTAATAVLAALFYSLGMLAVLALITAIFSGISKLAIDASIQERVPERLRASAFAHSETVLMVAWVLGGGIGIIPLPGRAGVALAAVLAVAAAGRAGYMAARLHNERLSGRAGDSGGEPDGPGDGPGSVRGGVDDGGGGDGVAARAGGGTGSDAAGGSPATARSSRAPAGSYASRGGDEPTDPWPDAPTVPARSRANPAPRSRAPESRTGRTGETSSSEGRRSAAGGASEGRRSGGTRPVDPTRVDHRRADERWADRTRADRTEADRTEADAGAADRPHGDPTRVEPPAPPKRRFGWLRGRDAGPAAAPAGEPPAPSGPPPSGAAHSRRDGGGNGRDLPDTRRDLADTRPDLADGGGEAADTRPDPAMAPPGFHVYRPSSAERPPADGPAEDDR
jgi:MFS family permease